MIIFKMEERPSTLTFFTSFFSIACLHDRGGFMTKLVDGNSDLSHQGDDSHEMDDSREHREWDRLLADAAPRDHVVQLYQDQDFLNRAVCRFAAAALANGEAVILVPTLAHWNAFRPRLEAEGVDVES